MSEILKNPRLYVNKYLETNNISVNERGELICSSGKNNLDLFNTMYLDYDQQVRAHNANEATKAANIRDKVSVIPEKMMQKALDELISSKKITYRIETINSLQCKTEDLSETKRFIQALTGKVTDEDLAVLSHWMWQVKTKMKQGSPSYHIMPIFFGKQEGGKTVALNKLIGPINNFRLNISLEQMTDDRYFKAMSENFVIVFDEMERADRTDIDALKKQVTIDFNDYRPLGTNSVFKVRQACSFIGATNRPVAEQIVDSTGMRRFWQVDCMDKLDWNVLNSINYTAMWQGIDENRVDGYILDKINEIRAKQQGLVAKEELQMFIESKSLDSTKTGKKVTSEDLYREYKFWSQDNGFKPMNNVWFGRKMAGKGFKTSVIKMAGKTHNVYDLNTDCQLDDISSTKTLYKDFI
jgi:hypothetical protein